LLLLLLLLLLHWWAAEFCVIDCVYPFLCKRRRVGLHEVDATLGADTKDIVAILVCNGLEHCLYDVGHVDSAFFASLLLILEVDNSDIGKNHHSEIERKQKEM
jgi:hypothetical protein